MQLSFIHLLSIFALRFLDLTPPCVAKLGHVCAYVRTHKRSQVNVPESGHKAKASNYLERLTK